MRGKGLGMMAVMAAMLGQGLAVLPPQSNRPEEKSFTKNHKHRPSIESPTLEKRRKAKRRISNASRKVNQAYARQQ